MLDGNQTGNITQTITLKELRRLGITQSLVGYVKRAVNLVTLGLLIITSQAYPIRPYYLHTEAATQEEETNFKQNPLRTSPGVGQNLKNPSY
jgi:hypothetical protein